MLESDHSQNLAKAKSVAQEIGMTSRESVDAEQKATYDKLNQLSGQRFDKEFARHMFKTTGKISASLDSKPKITFCR